MNIPVTIAASVCGDIARPGDGGAARRCEIPRIRLVDEGDERDEGDEGHEGHGVGRRVVSAREIYVRRVGNYSSCTALYVKGRRDVENDFREIWKKNAKRYPLRVSFDAKRCFTHQTSGSSFIFRATALRQTTEVLFYFYFFQTRLFECFWKSGVRRVRISSCSPSVVWPPAKKRERRAVGRREGRYRTRGGQRVVRDSHPPILPFLPADAVISENRPWTNFTPPVDKF